MMAWKVVKVGASDSGCYWKSGCVKKLILPLFFLLSVGPVDQHCVCTELTTVLSVERMGDREASLTSLGGT